MKLAFVHAGKSHLVELRSGRDGYLADLEGLQYKLAARPIQPGEVELTINEERSTLLWAKDGRDIWLHLGGKSYHVQKAIGTAAGAAAVGSERILRAPMPGLVRQVLVTAGHQATVGETLLILEAMKMEIRIQAPQAGKLAQVAVKQGQTVEKDQVLIEFEEQDAG